VEVVCWIWDDAFGAVLPCEPLQTEVESERETQLEQSKFARILLITSRSVSVNWSQKATYKTR
jgi:DNA-binding transcriptional regulator YiaG